MTSHAFCIFPSGKKLLSHERLGREEVAELVVTHLGVNPTKISNEVADTKGAHAIFNFLEELYKYHLWWDEDAEGDDDM